MSEKGQSNKKSACWDANRLETYKKNTQVKIAIAHELEVSFYISFINHWNLQ